VTRTPLNSEVLSQYVSSALEQWKYTLPLLRDKREITRGTKKVLYSVDSDVVKLFTDPLKVAASVKGRPYGYLQLFYDDRQEECVARGRIVAEHIFRGLRQGVPLLIIPPLTRELIDIHDTVADRANTEQFRAQHQLREFKDRLEAIRKTGNSYRLFRVLSEHAPHLVRLIEGNSDATAELRRFSVLFRDQLIAGPEFFVKRRLLEGPILSSIQSVLHTNLASDIDIEGRRAKWAELLGKAEYKAIPAGRDAEAMARLELINTLLPQDVKIVHITGDAHILAAGELKTFPDGSNFTERYLRHPRAFLAEPGVLLLDKNTSGVDETGENDSLPIEFSEFSKWLIVFLARFWKKNYLDIRQAIETSSDSDLKATIDTVEIKQFCRDFPDIVTSFRNRWDEFSRTLILGHTRKMLETMPYMRDVQAQLKLSFDEIETRVTKYIDDSWQSTFEVATATSYGMTRTSADRATVQKTGRVLARSVPLIYFESFPKTTLLIKEIIQATSLADIGPDRYADIFKKIKTEDSSGYLYYLAYATLFSAEGRWVLARILAERAFRLRQFANSEKITGREAAYFCAVSIRNSARSNSDVAIGLRWLERAEECLANDKRRRPKLQITNTRFDVEKLSLTFSGQLFHLFGSGDQREVALEIDKLDLLRESFYTLLRNVMAPGGKTPKTPIEFHDEWVRQVLQRRILINLLMIALIKTFYFNQSPTTSEWSLLQSHHKLLASNVDSDIRPRIEDNYLYNTVWRLAKIWMIDRSSSLISETKQTLSDSLIERYSTMPYDKERYLFFRGAIDKLSTLPNFVQLQ
jgi:hypothetical protein